MGKTNPLHWRSLMNHGTLVKLIGNNIHCCYDKNCYRKWISIHCGSVTNKSIKGWGVAPQKLKVRGWVGIHPKGGANKGPVQYVTHAWSSQIFQYEIQAWNPGQVLLSYLCESVGIFENFHNMEIFCVISFFALSRSPLHVRDSIGPGSTFGWVKIEEMLKKTGQRFVVHDHLCIYIGSCVCT